MGEKPSSCLYRTFAVSVVAAVVLGIINLVASVVTWVRETGGEELAGSVRFYGWSQLAMGVSLLVLFITLFWTLQRQSFIVTLFVLVFVSIILSGVAVYKVFAEGVFLGWVSWAHLGLVVLLFVLHNWDWWLKLDIWRSREAG